jgi:FkbM family methyltransferase
MGSVRKVAKILSDRMKVLSQRALFAPKLDVVTPIEWLGNPMAGFYVSMTDVPAEPIVYSFGIGYDVSFDLALIKKFQAQIFAFDPLESCIAYVAALPVDKNHLQSFQVGLYHQDTIKKFFIPTDRNFSATLYERWKNSPDVSEQQVQLKTLSSIANTLGHTHINILKLDIEGAEYEVLENVLNTKIEIDQILIEFHHRFPGRGVNDTRKAISLLRDFNYGLTAFSSKKEEFTFIKRT